MVYSSDNCYYVVQRCVPEWATGKMTEISKKKKIEISVWFHAFTTGNSYFLAPSGTSLNIFRNNY